MQEGYFSFPMALAPHFFQVLMLILHQRQPAALPLPCGKHDQNPAAK